MTVGGQGSFRIEAVLWFLLKLVEVVNTESLKPHLTFESPRHHPPQTTSSRYWPANEVSLQGGMMLTRQS